MFAEFHGLSENPFTIMPNPRLAWLGSGMRKVRAELCKAVLEGRGLVLLSGGPGVGKSLALNLLATDLKQSGAPCRIHVLICGQHVSAAELLRRVAEDSAGDDRAPAADRLTVLLIDEAQHLDSAELGEFLEEMALRGDRLRLVLAGAPELELAVNEALVEHPGTVAAHWSLEPLPPDEISSYIAGRLHIAGGRGREIFTTGAIECLARHSSGVPCRLNGLCSTALFIAWREGRHDIDTRIVEAAFNFSRSLVDGKPRLPTPMSMSTHPPLIEVVLPEAKDVLMAELESAGLEASVKPAALDDARSKLMERVAGMPAQAESVTLPTSSRETVVHRAGAAMVETSEYATDVAVAAMPVSREIAEPQPEAKPLARQHRPVPVPIWTQIWRRPAGYVPAAGVAAIVFLLVAIDWRARDEQPVGKANTPMTAVTTLPSDPPVIAATNQPTAPSSSPDPAVAEPVQAEESPAPVIEHPAGQASAPMTAVTTLPSDPPVITATNQPTAPSSSPDPAAAEPVQAEESPAPVIGQPGHASAGGPPPETIGPVELAELLARARQQMKALALTTPAGDNALETLRRVLAAMPSQPDALQGIHDIANKYAELAEQAERRGEHGLAKRYVDKGLDLAPDDPDLLAAQQQLTEQPAVPQPLGDAGAGGPPPETIGPVELAELLARARQQMEALALTTPAGDNALETLQRVLAAVPGQPDALQGIHDIASKYAILAAQAERRGEHALAKRYLDKGLVVAPDDPDLFAAQQKVTAQPAF